MIKKLLIKALRMRHVFVCFILLYLIAAASIQAQSLKFKNNIEPRDKLGQNNPNPFAETTEINYYIPASLNGQAKLIIADEKGIQHFQEFDACFGKPCQIKVSAKELPTGVYIYGIALNGKLVKSQKMMIIK